MGRRFPKNGDGWTFIRLPKLARKTKQGKPLRRRASESAGDFAQGERLMSRVDGQAYNTFIHRVHSGKHYKKPK